MKKILIISPHYSTGGSCEVTANKISLLKNEYDIKIIEHAFHSWKYVVHRNRIIQLVGESNFISLGENKTEKIKEVIDSFQPDLVMMEEFPEFFLSNESSKLIYNSERKYKIIETTHDSSFDVKRKTFLPDRFVFVSPYNALKYNHLNVPIEIIEYPVDLKQRNKAKAMETLGLDFGYVHIVIVGLFTARKNQKYAFEIAAKLSKYRVKFHFLGNQAENFQDYWKPLMETKPDNCVVWGERGDITTFLEASDLFLFTSKGDRGNKELNPIVIKEALQYEDLPKLMFNLDVYLNRYNDTHNMSFLTGNLEQDAAKVLELTNPKTIENQDEIILLGTYPNLKSRVQLTKDTILSLKPLGRKIMLLSHYPVDDEIQRMVDYYIYDDYNPLTHHSYYTRFYRYTDDFDVTVNINGLKQSNQSLTVLTNLFNGVKAAKNLGYKTFFYTTYDVILDKRDLVEVERSYSFINNTIKAYLATLKTPFEYGIQTNGMTFDIDFFLDNFHDVRQPEVYNKICEHIGSQNFLEDYFVKIVNQDHIKPQVLLVMNAKETFLLHSGLGVASNSEYYSILPIDRTTNQFMFYFYTYNVDGRKIDVVIEEDGNPISMFRIDILKSREFKQSFNFNGKPIKLKMEFYDGDTICKTETYNVNKSNLEIYQNTGVFKPKNIKPKIKLVHIQTTINDTREQKSRESVSPIQNYGIEYILHTAQPYASLPPKYNSQRPDCVSMELFDDNKVQQFGTALTPPHYGCYEAFKNAILSEFDDCDFLIVCEGDCLIEVPMQEFADKVFKAATICQDNNIGYMSFGDTKTLEHGWLQSNRIGEVANQDLLFITDKIIGLQCIMFSKGCKKWLKETLRTHKWDAADIYFNNIFRGSAYKMGILNNRITSQVDGYSLIDQTQKNFK